MDAIAKVIEKSLHGLALVQRVESLFTGNSVYERSGCVVADLQQGLEAVRKDDLSLADGNGSDTYDAVPFRIQTHRFAIEHDESHGPQWRITGPGAREACLVDRDGGKKLLFRHHRSESP